MIVRAILLAAMVTAECSAADLYPVAGTIVNTATNAPLSRAYVSFYRPNSTAAVARTITAENGRFQFELPAGSYRMLAGTRDAWENYGSRTPGSMLGSAVIVGPGKDTANILFRYFPPGAISGRVVDEFGEPAPNMLVQLIRANIANGLRAPAIYAFVRTDDSGAFRFDRLPGNVPYYLAVTGEPWYTRESAFAAPPESLQGLSESHAAAAYAPLYYPNTTDRASAAPVVVKSGEEAQVDFRLTTVVSGSVTVLHNGPPGLKGTVALTYDGVAGTIATQQVQQLATVFVTPGAQQVGAERRPMKQSQTLRGVPPGHYNLTVTGTVAGGVFMGTAPVDVNSSDIAVDLGVKTLPKVEGVVRLLPEARQRGRILVAIRAEANGTIRTAEVKSDGSFSFAAVPPGHFRVSLSSPEGFFASRIEAQGARIEDNRLEVAEDRDVSLSITASNAVGEVRGVVVDGEHLVEGALVVLYAVNGGSGTEARYRSFQTESDGSFDFRAVPAGRYFLFAIDDSQLEYSRADIVAPYLQSAKLAEVGAGSSEEFRISMTRLGR